MKANEHDLPRPPGSAPFWKRGRVKRGFVKYISVADCAWITLRPADERTVHLGWGHKHLGTLAGVALKLDRYREALEEILMNASLEGFPEDAPDQVARINQIATDALREPNDRLGK